MALGWFFSLFFIIASFTIPSLEAKTSDVKIKAIVAPYLLPEGHPVKAELDALFKSSRAILNLKTLEKAGFVKTAPRQYTKLIITTHPSLPGYYFKLYLDSQRFYSDEPEYIYWIKRIKTANKIRNAIAQRGLDAEFKVPHKWIYQLPNSPKPPNGYAEKHYILVAEDMVILPDAENEALWASDSISHQLLTDLYGLLKDLGLRDCTKPDNLPFSYDGRVSFIDTQYLHRSVDFEDLSNSLSLGNREFWKSLFHH